MFTVYSGQYTVQSIHVYCGRYTVQSIHVYCGQYTVYSMHVYCGQYRHIYLYSFLLPCPGHKRGISAAFVPSFIDVLSRDIGRLAFYVPTLPASKAAGLIRRFPYKRIVSGYRTISAISAISAILEIRNLRCLKW